MGDPTGNEKDEATRLVSQVQSLQQLLNAERRALRQLDRELVDTRSELDRLKSGIAFRAVSSLWGVKDLLLPEDSRRRRGYDALKKRLRGG